MGLTWNEIGIRAAEFAEEWMGETYERGEAQSFYNHLFSVFGVKRRAVARFEEHVRKLDNKTGFIDLFWPGTLIAEHKSGGRDLAQAASQVGEYFDGLKEHEKPRFQLVCDFQSFSLLDRDTGRTVDFQLRDFPKHIYDFSFILGRQAPPSRSLVPVNFEAAKHISDLYKALKKAKYKTEDLDRLLTRIVFCLFADNTGIFQPRGSFHDWLTQTDSTGLDLGEKICHLFQILDTQEQDRAENLDPDLAQFPYINGGLFSGSVSIPSLNSGMRDMLVKAADFDWSAVSPAIFGSLYQSVFSKEQRQLGQAHFTSEENIKKVLDSLCFNDLWAELGRIKGTRFRNIERLQSFREKLRSLRFFDPACGCGNFLVVAYSEIRKLELEAVFGLIQAGVVIPKNELSIVDVDQFFGIELHEYSVRIAETAMWMTDHLANNALSARTGQEFYRVPLTKTPDIRLGDALQIDWSWASNEGTTTYVLCNPPYQGAKQQKSDVRDRIRRIAGLGGQGGTLDMVSGWVIKTAEFLRAHGGKGGLVTTNSIVQGEQVAQLWPVLFDRYEMEIEFAHQSFKWKSGATGDAQVEVVIVGLVRRNEASKQRSLYQYETSRGHPKLLVCEQISPYLICADNLSDPHISVVEEPKPKNGLRALKTGTKPIDGGYYILSDAELSALERADAGASKFARPFVGSKELLEGGNRYLLVLKDASPAEIASHPELRKLIKLVEKFRLGLIPNKKQKKGLKAPNALSSQPTSFHINTFPDSPYLVLPEVSSEKRPYLPVGWLEPPTVPSNLVKVLQDATPAEFGLLVSSMHMSWLRHIGGHLEGRYRYSIGLAYNTFPVAPNVFCPKLNTLAEQVLAARKLHSSTPLEVLYDPSLMPPSLRAAHDRLDQHVEMAYLGRSGSSDQERIECLLNMYAAARKSSQNA